MLAAKGMEQFLEKSGFQVNTLWQLAMQSAESFGLHDKYGTRLHEEFDLLEIAHNVANDPVL